VYKKNDRVGGQFSVIWRFLSATKVVSKVEVDMEEVGEYLSITDFVTVDFSAIIDVIDGLGGI
jgi:hypothetical protein